MRILIAPDSFKESLSAIEVAHALASGLRRALPQAALTIFPLADGGEGTADILTYHVAGNWVKATVMDPLGRPVEAGFGLTRDTQTAFVDLAKASGLQLVEPHLRNPMHTSTFGTGQLLQLAIEAGARHIVLGIGGSATNDGGMGMAAALGYRFLDKNGENLDPVGGNLVHLQAIDCQEVLPGLPAVTFTVLCDVVNPLFGPDGAAFVFAPQKGATPQQVYELDQALQHYAGILEHTFGKPFHPIPGAGAAGGVGAGTMAFLNAQLLPGIDTVLKRTDAEALIRQSDIIITGEGKMDGQTQHGKLISGLCKLAGKYKVPVVAVCGALSVLPAQIEQLGLRAAFSISQGPATLADSLVHAAENLEKTAYNVGRILKQVSP